MTPYITSNLCVCVCTRAIVCGLFSAADEPKHRSFGVIGEKRGRGGEEGPCVGEREGSIKNGTRKLFAICFYGSFPWRNEGGGAGKSDGRRWPLPRLNVNAVGHFLSEAAAEELN